MKKIISLLSVLALALVTGCATQSGRQDAGRTASFSQAKDGTATGEATITREFDPASGKIAKEITALKNVASFQDRDKSRVGARGFFSMQTVKNFFHDRLGFLGSSSKTGVATFKADPDAEAIKAGGEAGGTILEKGIKAATGK